MAPMRRAPLFAPILGLALALVSAAASATLPGFYAAQVPVDGQTESDRAEALPRALLEVLVKVSGDRTLRDLPELEAVLAEAPNVVRDTRFVTETVPAPGGGESVRTMLVASFDPAGIGTLLRIVGRSVWENRPPTVVWLVIDDGTSKRVATNAQAAALGPLTRRAGERGIPIRLPDFDATDRGTLDPEVLWIGAPEIIARASARYAQVALVVRLTRRADGWAARNTLIDSGQVQDWTGTHADANDALQSAIDGAADRLAVRYAIAPEDQVPGVHRAWVRGIRNARDYAAVASALSALTEVNAVRIDGADGDRLLVTIDARVRLGRVLRLQTRRPLLAQVEGAATDGADVVLELRAP
jgi:hypothetical protein